MATTDNTVAMAQAMKPTPPMGIATAAASASSKRPAESPAAPAMTKAAAAKALSSLKTPKLKSQSQYVRFKSLVLKDAKDRGDTETSGNITKVAKDAWANVKHLTPPPPVDPATNTNSTTASSTSNLSEDMQRYLLLKGRVIKDEQDDKQKFNAEVKAYCVAFVPAATSHLQWQTIAAAEDNFASLVEAVELVAKKYESSYWSSGVDKAPLTKSLNEAKVNSPNSGI